MSLLALYQNNLPELNVKELICQHYFEDKLRDIHHQVLPHNFDSYLEQVSEKYSSKFVEKDFLVANIIKFGENNLISLQDEILKRVKRRLRPGWGCSNTGLEIFAIPLFLIYMLTVFNQSTGFFDLLFGK